MVDDEFKPIERKPKPLPNFNNGVVPTINNRDNIQAWNERVKKVGRPERIINTKISTVISNNLLYIFLVLIVFLIAFFVVSFVYFGNNEVFKSIFVDNSSCVNNQAVIPPCPNCSLSCGSNNYTPIFKLDSVTLNIDTINVTKYNSTCLVGCLSNYTNSS